MKLYKLPKNPKPRKFIEGQTCPVCEGEGSYLEEGDAHRSTGWVPCRFSIVGLACRNGKLVKS